MIMDKYYIITFENTHGAMNGETILKGESINIDIMPTPTSISKSCGISIRVKEEFINDVKSLIVKDKLKVKNIYVKEGIDYKIFDL